MNYALSKKNLTLIGVGFVIILIGFCCMIGGGSEDGVTFNPEVFSTRRTVVGPMIALFGFFFEIYAILRAPKEGESSNDSLLNILKKNDNKEIAASDDEKAIENNQTKSIAE